MDSAVVLLGSIVCVFLVIVLYMQYLAMEERAGCFISVVFLLSCRGDVGWSVTVAFSGHTQLLSVAAPTSSLYTHSCTLVFLDLKLSENIDFGECPFYCVVCL